MITGYTVEYSSTTPPTTNTMSGSSNRELVVGGLLPRTSYTFTVRAEGASHTTNALLLLQVSNSSSSIQMSHCNSLCAHAELGFFLDGTFLSNNSIVLLSDIGEGSNALFCLTNRIQCWKLEVLVDRNS